MTRTQTEKLFNGLLELDSRMWVEPMTECIGMVISAEHEGEKYDTLFFTPDWDEQGTVSLQLTNSEGSAVGIGEYQYKSLDPEDFYIELMSKISFTVTGFRG